MLKPLSILNVIMITLRSAMNTIKSIRKTRSITLQSDTFDRIEKIKAGLIGRMKDPNLSFNDVIKILIDNFEQKDM